MTPRLLVVDDDAAIRTLVADSLGGHGYRVTTAAGAREMDLALARDPVDLVILDVMMPGEDGLSACRRLHAAGGPAVVILSARGAELDRIAGLETGASHYLPKPCSPHELLATVRAALRARAAPAAGRRLGFAGWEADLTAHELRDPAGVLVDLTDGEFAVLRAFLDRPRQVLSRDELLIAARGPDSDAFDRAVDTQVSRLRRKLRSPDDAMIRTVRQLGYLFVPAVARR